jgi:hypothetical protein
MTSYKLTDLNSDILNKIYEEITNRNKGEIREIAVFKEKYKKFMEKYGMNPKHFRKWPSDGDGEFDFEINTTYKVILDDPDYKDAEYLAAMIRRWIIKYSELLSLDEKNNIICWYGIHKVLSLFYDHCQIQRHESESEICGAFTDPNCGLESTFAFLILCDEVEFNSSSEWRKD